jgi:hypothetical protein
VRFFPKSDADTSNGTRPRNTEELFTSGRAAGASEFRCHTPLSVPEDELIPLEEFKKNFEDAIYDDLGLKITL